jgi:SNF2 family DNA or RNA helicase
LIKVEKIINDPDGYDYAISFCGNKKQFNTYMRFVGSIMDKKYDFARTAWKFKEHQYKILQALIDEAMPKKATTSASIISVKHRDVHDYDDIGKSMKLPPYPYQKETIKFALDNLNTLLVLPCGSGKTPVGIGLFLEARERNIIEGQGVIVVKASLKTQWAKEVEKFSSLKPVVIQTSKDITSSTRAKIARRDVRLRRLVSANASTNEPLIRQLEMEIIGLEKEARQLFKSQFKKADLLIMNYETLNDVKVRSELHRIKPQFFFVDEIHYAKGAETDRSKSLCEFADTKVKAGATATPVQRDPRDIYGIFKFINPKIFVKKTDFDRLFLKFAGRGRVVGSKNEKLLNDKISPFMIVKSKEEVSEQLPSLVVMQRYCDLEPAQVEMTDRLKDEIEELKRKEDAIRATLNSDKEAEFHPEIMRLEAHILARQTFAQELADSEELLKLSKSEMAKEYVTGSNDNKMDLLTELLEEILESGEKACVFSRFAKMQDIITARIAKEARRSGSAFKGVKIAYVHGALDDKKRHNEVYDKFRDTDEYKILLMSDAGAEGINLSKCKYVIEMEPAESYAIQTQRQGRVERADSVHDTVFVYQLLANDSWDEIGVKIVAKKENYDTTLIRKSAMGGVG